jgi:hypothetical protein
MYTERWWDHLGDLIVRGEVIYYVLTWILESFGLKSGLARDRAKC